MSKKGVTTKKVVSIPMVSTTKKQEELEKEAIEKMAEIMTEHKQDRENVDEQNYCESANEETQNAPDMYQIPSVKEITDNLNTVIDKTMEEIRERQNVIMRSIEGINELLARQSEQNSDIINILNEKLSVLDQVEFELVKEIDETNNEIGAQEVKKEEKPIFKQQGTTGYWSGVKTT